MTLNKVIYLFARVFVSLLAGCFIFFVLSLLFIAINSQGGSGDTNISSLLPPNHLFYYLGFLAISILGACLMPRFHRHLMMIHKRYGPFPGGNNAITRRYGFLTLLLVVVLSIWGKLITTDHAQKIFMWGALILIFGSYSVAYYYNKKRWG